MDESCVEFRRRHFLTSLSALGLGATLLPEALLIAAQDADVITVEILEAAQKIAGVPFRAGEKNAIPTRPNAPGGYRAGFEGLRRANLRDDEIPEIVFMPVLPEKRLPSGARGLIRRSPDVSRPPSDEALAYLPV